MAAPLIDLQGPDKATGFVYAEFRSGTQGLRMTHVGVYEDTYVKESGRWKFKQRKLTSTPITA